MDRLASIHRNMDAFSSLRYIGIQTRSGPTDFEVSPISILVILLLLFIFGVQSLLFLLSTITMLYYLPVAI